MWNTMGVEASPLEDPILSYDEMKVVLIADAGS
jgi:hypothetical protein